MLSAGCKEYRRELPGGVGQKINSGNLVLLDDRNLLFTAVNITITRIVYCHFGIVQPVVPAEICQLDTKTVHACYG